MTMRIGRWVAMVLLVVTMVSSLNILDRHADERRHDERLYFPSGQFLVESSLGFREAMADWLWFRFVQ